jgi:hypothetical protein
MDYKVTKNLLQAGPISQGESEETGYYLKGVEPIFGYLGLQNDCGEESVEFFPVYYLGDGKRGFLVERTWCPNKGYTAEGVNQGFISIDRVMELIARKCVVSEEQFNEWFEVSSVIDDTYYIRYRGEVRTRESMYDILSSNLWPVL